MSSPKLRELQEKLLPPQNNGAPISSSWSGLGLFLGEQSTSRSLPSHHCLPPLQEFDESTCIKKQAEYLRSLTETVTVTDETFPDFHPGLGQSTQISMSPDRMDGILEAITSGQEFPESSSSASLNSSSGIFDSCSEMLSSTSVLCFGDNSATLGMHSESSSCSDTAPLNSLFRHSQQPIITSAGIITMTSDHDNVSPYDVRKGITSSGHEVSDLVGVNPFNAGTEIDIQRYLIQELEVNFCDLENRVFEKQQSRKDKQARQRIINGRVKFLVRSDCQVKNVRAWVRREIKAAKMEKDVNGMVPIQAVFLRKDGNNLEYQVDLDSVYKAEGSDRPVYKLAKVHTQERNQFELLVQVVFTNNEVSEHIKSKPFLIKTKRINEEPAEPAIYSKEKRKRPNTCPSSSVRWSSQAGEHQPIHFTQQTLQNEPDSTGSTSPLSSCSVGSRMSALSSEGTSQLDHIVVKHLKAQQANIEKLSFGCMMQTSRGDIAYHLRLTNPDIYQTLEEGVVVGFFPDDEGPATIQPLSSENASQAVMAGVISRSAYVEAHAPSDQDIGQTDIVCVIGMVKVQIVGSVRTGERIYASTDSPGTSIPESHLPLGALIIRPNNTLLGMAMETCKPCHHDEVNLVNCFVCIVLGINSHQLSSEVENIMENIDMDIKVAIGKSNKTTCRRMYLLLIGFIIFLGLLGFFLYELLTPGSLFRYFLCRKGSCSGSHLKCNFRSNEEHLDVNFIPFDFLNLKEKIPTGELMPTERKNGSAIYFLNYDRCAYGGRTDASKYSLEKAKPVRGPTYLASNEDCTEIFSFQSFQTDEKSEKGNWKLLNWTATHPHEHLVCLVCSSAGNFFCQWIVLLLSFAVYCLV